MDSLIHRIKQGLSTVELVHIPHNRWPLPRRSFNAKSLRISVLDSSFNPPTLAHLALANTPASTHTRQGVAVSATHSTEFDAKLLLLSVRNADKSLKPGDATYAQRLDMMMLLAQDMQKATSSSVRADLASIAAEDDGNVAVAIVDEPTFVGKSRVLSKFLAQRIAASYALNSSGNADESVSPVPQLTFLMGIDTLERILSSRYYETEDAMRQSLHHFLSPEGDGSRIICARRDIPGLPEQQDEQEARVMRTVRELLAPDRVTMVDIPETVRGFSSSEVRQRMCVGDDLCRTMVTDIIADYISRHQLYMS